MTVGESTSLPFRQLECFLALAEELHFGRTAERLGVSQSRVTQLIQALESDLGERLFDRTSRRVRLTDAGERLRTDLDPVYARLLAGYRAARRRQAEPPSVLRVGFQGWVPPAVSAAAVWLRERRGLDVRLHEIPLADPFSALRRAELDCAVVLTPMEEPDLRVDLEFSRWRREVALSSAHPLAARDALTTEDLAGVPTVRITGPAPPYWRDFATVTRTPSGRVVPAGPEVSTFEEGMSAVVAGTGAMLLCTATAEMFARAGITYVPIGPLPDSALVLVRRADDPGELPAVLADAVLRQEAGASPAP